MKKSNWFSPLKVPGTFRRGGPCARPTKTSGAHKGHPYIFFLCLVTLTFSEGLLAQEETAPPAEETAAPAASQGEAVDAAFTPYSEAETPSSAARGGKGFEERVSLDLRNIDVNEALRFLATKAGINMAISKSVAGRLQLLLDNVPLKDVFDIILLTNGLAYDKQGEIYNIMTEEEYKARYGRNFSDARQVKVFSLKYAIPSQVFSMMDALKSEVGRVLVDQESGTALVIDTEQSLQRIEEAVTTLEKKRTIQVFPLQYASAKDVEERLKTQLDTKEVGSVIADERTNQIVVQTLPERMEAIAHLVASLDKKTKEVLVIARIIKVSLSDTYTSQIEWEGFFQQADWFPIKNAFLSNHNSKVLARSGTSAVDDFISITPTTRPAETGKHSFTENLVVGRTGDDPFESIIKYLRTLGNTRVLSSPRLLIVNNTEAKIHVGERQAYVTTTTTTGTSTTTTAEQVTFVDVGIQLGITPTINDDGFITMKIKPEISGKVSELTTPSGNKIPIIDTSEAETTVMVKDGKTVIIAGLRRDDKTLTDERVPYLSDVPVLGRLFRSLKDVKTRGELLVLLTPHLVGGEHVATGEPGHASTAMKSYRDYPGLGIQPEEEPGFFSPLFGFIKKVFLFGRD